MGKYIICQWNCVIARRRTHAKNIIIKLPRFRPSIRFVFTVAPKRAYLYPYPPSAVCTELHNNVINLHCMWWNSLCVLSVCLLSVESKCSACFSTLTPFFLYLTMNEGIIQSIFIRHPFGVCGFANGQKFGVSVYAGCRAVNAAVVYYNYVVMLSDGGAVLVWQTFVFLSCDWLKRWANVRRVVRYLYVQWFAQTHPESLLTYV